MATHRMSKTPEWQAWSDMRRRCRDPKRQSAKYYLGRGIKVCERWQSFEAFYADVGPKPSPQHSLGRIDNDGNYEPENVRWEMPGEQARNTRRNFLITAFGRTAPLGWFISPVLCFTAYKRARKRILGGWDHEDALLEPVDLHRRLQRG